MKAVLFVTSQTTL